MAADRDVTDQERNSFEDKRDEFQQAEPIMNSLVSPRLDGETPGEAPAPALLVHRRTYLDLDTIMICNPNAMSYQHMINFPHAYYLKYFLNKNMNVLVWNYRGYGRTKGQPEPELLFYEAEQVLHFLKTRIGVRGKIGIYGRSIGCTAACKLTPYADMIIADRGFDNL